VVVLHVTFAVYSIPGHSLLARVKTIRSGFGRWPRRRLWVPLLLGGVAMGVTVLFPSRHSGNHRSGLLDWAAAAPRRHSVYGGDALNVREVPIVAWRQWPCRSHRQGLAVVATTQDMSLRRFVQHGITS
jgi:hypothetical protein